MGFTPLDGLPMCTRCGAIGSGVLLYLMDQHKMDTMDRERNVGPSRRRPGPAATAGGAPEDAPPTRRAAPLDIRLVRCVYLNGGRAAGPRDQVTAGPGKPPSSESTRDSREFERSAGSRERTRAGLPHRAAICCVYTSYGEKKEGISVATRPRE
jgi:Acetokinase family